MGALSDHSALKTLWVASHQIRSRGAYALSVSCVWVPRVEGWG